MKDNELVTVNVGGHNISGCVARVINDRRVEVTIETSDLHGFSPICTFEYTLRKNGTWVRKGVATGRGWEITYHS